MVALEEALAKFGKPEIFKKAAPDRNIGNVGSPDVVRPLDRQIAQEGYPPPPEPALPAMTV